MTYLSDHLLRPDQRARLLPAATEEADRLGASYLMPGALRKIGDGRCAVWEPARALFTPERARAAA